ENYLEAFSTHYLFLYVETSGLGGTYNVEFRGEMYIIELPFLLIGIYFLLRQKNNRLKYFIFGGLLISPLPSTFTLDRTYVMRSLMMLPFLCILVGYGIWEGYSLLKKYPVLFQRILLVCVTIFYLFLFIE